MLLNIEFHMFFTILLELKGTWPQLAFRWQAQTENFWIKNKNIIMCLEYTYSILVYTVILRIFSIYRLLPGFMF